MQGDQEVQGYRSQKQARPTETQLSSCSSSTKLFEGDILEPRLALDLLKTIRISWDLDKIKTSSSPYIWKLCFFFLNGSPHKNPNLTTDESDSPLACSTSLTGVWTCTHAALCWTASGRSEVGLCSAGTSDCELSVWAGWEVLKDSWIRAHASQSDFITSEQKWTKNSINKNRGTQARPPAPQCYGKRGALEFPCCLDVNQMFCHWTGQLSVFWGGMGLFSSFFTFTFGFLSLWEFCAINQFFCFMRYEAKLEHETTFESSDVVASAHVRLCVWKAEQMWQRTKSRKDASAKEWFYKNFYVPHENSLKMQNHKKKTIINPKKPLVTHARLGSLGFWNLPGYCWVKAGSPWTGHQIGAV